MKEWLRWIGGRRFPELRRELELLRLAVGRHEARAVTAGPLRDLESAEFRTFSQWGEDGIIQYLVSRVLIADRSFVELGVDDYRESNTRFLLENNNWRGLIVDAGTKHIRYLAET